MTGSWFKLPKTAMSSRLNRSSATTSSRVSRCLADARLTVRRPGRHAGDIRPGLAAPGKVSPRQRSQHLAVPNRHPAVPGPARRAAADSVCSKTKNPRHRGPGRGAPRATRTIARRQPCDRTAASRPAGRASSPRVRRPRLTSGSPRCSTPACPRSRAESTARASRSSSRPQHGDERIPEQLPCAIEARNVARADRRRRTTSRPRSPAKAALIARPPPSSGASGSTFASTRASPCHCRPDSPPGSCSGSATSPGSSPTRS